MLFTSASRSLTARAAGARGLAAVCALALGASLAACSTGGSGASDGAGREGALAVSASFYPIQYLVEQVGGEHVAVTPVTPANAEPHDFELAPRDVAALGEADLVTYTSGFQPSLDDALTQVSGPTVVDLAASVDLGGGEEADPHFWLDPTRMAAAAVVVEDALSEADPDHAADYEANLAALTATLEEIDASYTAGLASCERSTIVTSHAAFGYLTDRYGLTQESISGVDPETEPSPADLAAIKKVVVDTGTTTVFTEELVSPETAEAVAAETGATTAVLSPLESAPAEGDYASTMAANLEQLRTALSCQ